MDALIRGVQWAPSRMRLSDSRLPDQVALQPAGARESADQQRVHALRAELEKQLRAEMTEILQQRYEAEHERARAEGLAAARAAAAEEVAATREQLRATLESALEALERAHDSVLGRIECSVGEVAFAAVCRFVSHEAVSPEFVRGVVEHACAQLRAETSATARLHPRDLALLDGMLEGGALRVQSIGLRLVPDESLPLGGCIVEAASGQFDGGLENQLRRLHAVLTAPLPAR
jgi:flagellar assembly protein FliH